MGMFGKSHRSSSSERTYSQPAPADPRPNVFRINWTEKKGSYLLAEIIYPHCTTFEGRKLIIFKDVTVDWLKSQREIDPHFHDGGNIIARFEPTKRGLNLAREMLMFAAWNEYHNPKI